MVPTHALLFKLSLPNSQDAPKVDTETFSASISDDASLFNWSLLDETFAGLESPIVSDLPAATQTSTSSEQPLCTLDGFSFSPALVDSLPPQPLAAAVPFEIKQEKAQPPRTKAMKPKRPSKVPVNLYPTDYDLYEPEEGECKPYSEKLPKELLDHPCAATLLSAGIRIKGRTREELLDLAERIKKRRRASAARCRARKATHVHHLEDENQELKEENMRLRQRIAQLTGGSLNLTGLLGPNGGCSSASFPLGFSL